MTMQMKMIMKTMLLMGAVMMAGSANAQVGDYRSELWIGVNGG